MNHCCRQSHEIVRSGDGSRWNWNDSLLCSGCGVEDCLSYLGCEAVLREITAGAVLVNSHGIDKIENFLELIRVSCNEVVTRVVVGFCCAT